MIPVSPRAAALRILAERRTGAADPPSSVFTLADFQQEAVARALAILRRRGGVLVADSVGLGKTFIGAALLEHYLEVDHPVAVVVPAALQPVWRRALRPLLEGRRELLRIITHGQLSRGFEGGSLAFVVVDEAHAFRNRHTRRYRALRRLIRRAPVALLTATPVNNSLSDLYFQIRLCVSDDAFRDLGIGSLAALLRAGPPDPDALARIRDAFIVRRTRAQLRHRFAEIQLPTGERLRFPAAVRLVNVWHAPPVPVATLEELLGRLSFAAYGKDTTGPLISLGLLKRIQSSRHAALASLDRLIDFHQRFLDALRKGRWLRPHLASDLEQLSFTELLLDHVPGAIDVAQLRTRVVSDIEVLKQFRAMIAASEDGRVRALRELLAARAPPARTIVFTEFRDTAEHLWRQLRLRFQTGLITGSHARLGEGRCSRQQVIRRFAPRANHAALPLPSEHVLVLIATDVLAEGLNLQDADAVVSYDLPWNPVRLIQRAGRIDRIGSPHDQVTVYNFMPDHDFDRVLGLVRRLRVKLEGVRSTIGQEAPVLESDEVSPTFFEDLLAGRTDALSGMVLPETPFADLDLNEAAPVGAVASESAHARRALVCWQFAGGLRELVVQGGGVIENHNSANAILELALELDTPACTSSCLVAAIDLTRRHLAIEAAVPPADQENGPLAAAIKRAIARYGILAPPELVQEADRVISAIHSNVYEAGQLRRVRSATSPDELARALREIRSACRERAQLDGDWELVAAVAVD